MKKRIFICDECGRESLYAGQLYATELCEVCASNCLYLIRRFRNHNQIPYLGFELWVPINHLMTSVVLNGSLKEVFAALKRAVKKSAEFYSPKKSSQLYKY
jgi:hypothetical protein